MFYQVNTKELLAQAPSGVQVIKESGIYDITILNAIVKENAQGAKSVWLQYALGESTVSSGMLFLKLEQNNKEKHFEAYIFERIMVCCGVLTINSLVKKEITTKKGTTTEDCIAELANKKIKVLINMTYQKYNGQISENAAIKDVARFKDNATAKEIIEKDPNKGEDFTNWEAFAVDVFRNTNANEVAAWKASQGNSGSSKPSTPAKAVDDNPFGDDTLDEDSFDLEG